jgi:hypothetical protein
MGEQGYVHPAVAVVMLLVMAVMLFLPRERVLTVFVAAGMLVPMDQLIVLGPFHFMMLRILILIGWIRCAAGDITQIGLSALDKLVLSYALIDALAYVILWGGSADAIVNRLGSLYTILGLYFLFRYVIRDADAASSVTRALAYVAVAIAVVMVIEVATGTNPYSLLGGSRAWTRVAVEVREGRLRAMGPFQHPILAGCFGGVTAPLFAGLWLRGKLGRGVAVLGLVSAVVIVVASACSTPIMALSAGSMGLLLWPARRFLRLFRWCLASGLVTLHLVMKAPVWALIQRVDIIGGSSSYHRYELVDQFIRHFDDWWLLGVKTTDNWGDFMWDHANQYVSVGTTSGLMSFVLFIAIIVYAFKLAGRGREAAAGNRGEELFFWALGTAILAHIVAFFGISYHDQMMLVWWGLLGITSGVCTNVKKCEAVPVQSVQPELWYVDDFAGVGAEWAVVERG